MSNWQNRLDISDIYHLPDDRLMTIQALGKEIAKRIRALRCYSEQKRALERLCKRFEKVKESNQSFNKVIAGLYDWADTELPAPVGEMQRKNLWIDTMSRSK